MVEGTARTGRRASLPGVAAVLFVALLALFPPPILAPAFERMSFLLFDNFQRAEPRPYEDAGVRVVDIDEETIRRLGQWPWPRTDIALLTDRWPRPVRRRSLMTSFCRSPTAPRRHGWPSGCRSTPRHGRAAGCPTMMSSWPRASPRRRSSPIFLTHDAYKGPCGQGVFGVGTDPSRLAASATRSPHCGDRSCGECNGFRQHCTDSDAIVRRAPLIARNGAVIVPSLSLDALRVAQARGP